ncbi:TniQ family protein [Streptomyces sp. NPDC048623]|uniref:TniQ family protein n=1 Tax=Streptomyces sp. NPDC048623 TaxID=3155761 RepID=UPI003446EEEE
MTDSTTGPRRAPSRTKPLKPADLPIRVPLIHGETNASFLARTASANGLGAQRLLKALHHGRLPARTRAQLRPGVHEVLLNASAVARLAVLTGREEEQLHRALPGLAAAQQSGGEEAAVELTVWPEGVGNGPLKACPLCLEDGAWLVAAGHRWRPCSCGRRWECGDDGGYLIDTTPVPEIGAALQHHRRFDHRMGPAGDALVADAHQVMLWWWASKLRALRDVWRRREDTLGVGARLRRRQAAPAVVYPETIRLARLMADWEARRTTGREASPRQWLADVAEALKVPGLADGRDADPLEYWLELHAPDAAGEDVEEATAAERRWARLPALHHPATDRGPFRAKPCLRWVHGLPVTSTTRPCPYCGGSELTCRWVPSDDCPRNPSPASGQ